MGSGRRKEWRWGSGFSQHNNNLIFHRNGGDEGGGAGGVTASHLSMAVDQEMVTDKAMGVGWLVEERGEVRKGDRRGKK